MAVYGSGGSTAGGYAPQARVRFEAISDALKLFQQQMGTWVLAVLIFLIIAGAISGIGQVLLLTGGAGAERAPGAVGVGAVFGFLVFILLNSVATALLMGGLFRMAVKQVRGEPISVGDLFGATDVLGTLIAAVLLTGLAVGLGTALCIIPGLIAAGLLMLANPLIVDRRLGAVEAMTQSWNALKGDLLMATVFYFVVTLVASLGIILCGVGVLFTYPLFFLSIAVVYRDFFLGGDAPSSPEAAMPGAYPPPPTGLSGV